MYPDASHEITHSQPGSSDGSAMAAMAPGDSQHGLRDLGSPKASGGAAPQELYLNSVESQQMSPVGLLAHRQCSILGVSIGLRKKGSIQLSASMVPMQHSWCTIRICIWVDLSRSICSRAQSMCTG